MVVDLDGDGNVEVAGRPWPAPTDTAHMLSFQGLDVYQRTIEFLSLVYEVLADLPRGNADRADQLTRSAESVVRNIAEGAGRWSEADMANRYKITPVARQWSAPLRST
jgi:hypothetical protein